MFCDQSLRLRFLSQNANAVPVLIYVITLSTGILRVGSCDVGNVRRWLWRRFTIPPYAIV